MINFDLKMWVTVCILAFLNGGTWIAPRERDGGGEIFYKMNAGWISHSDRAPITYATMCGKFTTGCSLEKPWVQSRLMWTWLSNTSGKKWQRDTGWILNSKLHYTALIFKHIPEFPFVGLVYFSICTKSGWLWERIYLALSSTVVHFATETASRL